MRKSIRQYNLNKNGLNSEAWDFSEVEDNTETKYNGENTEKRILNGDDDLKCVRKLQKSLQSIQVKADKVWAKKRRPDEWDTNYDLGRTKKVKNKEHRSDGFRTTGSGIGKKLQKLYERKHMKKKG